jgi:hypothetical protein
VGNGGQMFAMTGYCSQRLLKTGLQLFSLQLHRTILQMAWNLGAWGM